MPCDIVPTPDGGSAFVCSRGSRPRLSADATCPVCGEPVPNGALTDHLSSAHHLIRG